MELLIVEEKETAEELAARVALAKELGHKEILLLFQTPTKEHKALLKKLASEQLTSAILITTTNQAAALKRTYDRIVAPCKREFFESKHVDYLFEPEAQRRSDFIHHRNSGLNQVLLKLCQPTAKRPAKGIITTSELLLNTKHPAVILGRMQQNARWCKKYKVAYHVTSGARKMLEQRDSASLKALERVITS